MDDIARRDEAGLYETDFYAWSLKSKRSLLFVEGYEEGRKVYAAQTGVTLVTIPEVPPSPSKKPKTRIGFRPLTSIAGKADGGA